MAESISIVMPAYNEEDLIEDSLLELQDFLKRVFSEVDIHVVENGSDDDTLSILKKLSEEYECIRQTHLEQADVGRAVQKGFLDAIHERVVLLHVDLFSEDFIRESVRMLDDYSLVQSSKLRSRSDERPFLRKFLTWGYNFLLRILVGHSGTDTRGLKALRLDRLESVINDCLTARGMFETELVLRCQWEGIPVKEIPIEVPYERPPRNTMMQKFLQNVVDIIKVTWIIRTIYGFFSTNFLPPDTDRSITSGTEDDDP